MNHVTGIPEEVSLKFSQRYYQWSLADAESEVALDFPHSRTCHSRTSQFALWVFAGINDIPSRRALARARVNRLVMRTRLLNVNLTQEELEIIEWCKTQHDRYRFTSEAMKNRFSRTCAIGAMQTVDTRRIVEARMQNVFEHRLRWDEREAVCFATPVNGWSIQAMITFNSPGSLDCRHSIHGTQYIKLKPPVDPGRVAIGGAQWHYNSQDALNTAINAIARFSHDYLEATKHLLSDLPNPLGGCWYGLPAK